MRKIIFFMLFFICNVGFSYEVVGYWKMNSFWDSSNKVAIYYVYKKDNKLFAKTMVIFDSDKKAYFNDGEMVPVEKRKAEIAVGEDVFWGLKIREKETSWWDSGRMYNPTNQGVYDVDLWPENNGKTLAVRVWSAGFPFVLKWYRTEEKDFPKDFKRNIDFSKFEPKLPKAVKN